jgi:hypothetical protein
MRKAILFWLFCSLVVTSVSAQTDSIQKFFPMKENTVVYERIIDVEGADKAQLFKRAKLWALEAYKSQKAALQSEDKELGILVYDSYLITRYELPTGGYVPGIGDWQYYHTTMFNFKDGKVKVTVTIQNVASQISPSSKFDVAEAVLRFGQAKKKSDEPKFINAVHNNYRSANLMFQAMMDDIEKALKTKDDF